MVRSGFRQGEVEFDLEFPEKGAEFSGDGHDAFTVANAAGAKMPVALAKPLLHPPGKGFNFVGLAVLSFGELRADLGFAPVGLGAFAEHPTCVTVAAFGDAALSAFVTGRFFTRNQAKEGHELSGAFETTEVTDFTDDGHGSDFLESLAGHQGLHDRSPLPIRENMFEFFFEGLNTLEAAVDGLKVAFEHEALGGIRESEVAEIAHVGRSPFGCFIVTITVAKKEGAEPLLGPGKVIGGVGASPTEVANGFIKCRRNPDFGEVAIAEEFGDFLGIAFIGFDLLVGFTFRFGRGHDNAVDLELAESTSEDKTGWSSFVANFEVLDFESKFRRESSESSFGSEI